MVGDASSINNSGVSLWVKEKFCVYSALYCFDMFVLSTVY